MLEIITYTLEEAIRVEQLGASQIELVSGFAERGVTPSYGLVKRVIESVSFPVNVMLKPHSRGFVYSNYDLDVMREDAKTMEQVGVKNIVVGILNSDGLPDIKALDYILKETDLTITYQRAIDVSSNILQSLEILKSYPRVKTILTSGGEGKAVNNINVLKQIIENRGHIEILLGSGINITNIKSIYNELRIPNIHIGTGVRSGHYNNEISNEELSKLVSIYKNIKS